MGFEMYRAHTVSVAVAVNPERVYAYASDPGNLPSWAQGFVKSIEKRGDVWVAETTLGKAKFRFAPPNAFGVLDHDIELPSRTFHSRMRVIPNGLGSEILFTLLQLPGMTDEQFATDLDVVRNDLKTLRAVLERTCGSAA